MSDVYRRMYGGLTTNTTPTPAPEPKVPEKEKAAGKRLGGLKITNSHMHELEVDGRSVTIPSAAYVKLLEDQIKEFRNLVRMQGEDLKRANRSIMHLNRQVDKLQTQIIDLSKYQY